MELLPYAVILGAGLLLGILSGISGGGGGFVMIPLLIFIGLPPQMAVATGKMNGLGGAFGGLAAFAKTGLIRKDIVRVMIPIAIVIGLVAPLAFSAIDAEAFQSILGFLLLALTPTLFLRRRNQKKIVKERRVLGYSAYSGVLTLQAIFGSGTGTLAMFVLTLLFGTSKLEANATKRAVVAVLTPVTFVSLLVSGYVSVSHGLVGMVAAFFGANIGSKIAISKGEQFATYALAIFTVSSASILIFTAK